VLLRVATGTGRENAAPIHFTQIHNACHPPCCERVSNIIKNVSVVWTAPPPALPPVAAPVAAPLAAPAAFTPPVDGSAPSGSTGGSPVAAPVEAREPKFSMEHYLVVFYSLKSLRKIGSEGPLGEPVQFRASD
jgi:hypothetical protein